MGAKPILDWNLINMFNGSLSWNRQHYSLSQFSLATGFLRETRDNILCIFRAHKEANDWPLLPEVTATYIHATQNYISTATTKKEKRSPICGRSWFLVFHMQPWCLLYFPSSCMVHDKGIFFFRKCNVFFQPPKEIIPKNYPGLEI